MLAREQRDGDLSEDVVPLDEGLPELGEETREAPCRDLMTIGSHRLAVEASTARQPPSTAVRPAWLGALPAMKTNYLVATTSSSELLGGRSPSVLFAK